MIKVSDKSESFRDICSVTKPVIERNPIEELSYPIQMEQLQPWIKEIYGQVRLSNPIFSRPLAENSQYHNPEHKPISDWSARVNQDYYDNLLDLD